MSIKEWERLQENAIIKCHVAGEGEVCYKLTMQDHLSRWIAMKLDKQNNPVKATTLLHKPELFARQEN